MERRLRHLFPPIIYLFTILAILFVLSSQNPLVKMQASISDKPYNTHILGGFSIDTPERASKAAKEGVQVVFKYGTPPSESDKLGQELQSLHVKVIDGFISSQLFYYECHRTKTVKPPPPGQEAYCQEDEDPSLTNENVLLTTIAAHLKVVKDNHLIVGYWVLDDWVSWDAGSAQQILIKIHDLIQQYTPNRPAICGFGGALTLGYRSVWEDWIAENFSPQGCDMVGIYIYASSLPDGTPTSSPDAYDWSMSSILPAMFASLQQQGWNITQEPLIGIVQAFGGPIAYENRYWITPNATTIETQSRSYCGHGATGLTFYAWDDSQFGTATQTPINNSEIENGIRKGIAACKQYWASI